MQFCLAGNSVHLAYPVNGGPVSRSYLGDSISSVYHIRSKRFVSTSLSSIAAGIAAAVGGCSYIHIMIPAVAASYAYPYQAGLCMEFAQVSKILGCNMQCI